MIIIIMVIIITSFALFRQESRCLTFNTDLPVTGDYTPKPFSSRPLFFASSISNMNYPVKHSSHHTDLFSLVFAPQQTPPDSCKLLDTLGGKFRNVYTGLNHYTCFGNMRGEC